MKLLEKIQKKNYCNQCHKKFTSFRSNILKCKFCGYIFTDETKVDDNWSPGNIPLKIDVANLINESADNLLYLSRNKLPHTTIIIPLLTVATPQLYFKKENNEYFVNDIANDKFVTYINEIPIKTSRIKEGDVLQFGGLEYEFIDNSLCLKVRNKAPGIVADNITCRYKNDSDKIFSNKSFEIKPGELVALVGESGCGKSTLLKYLFQIAKKETKNKIVDINDNLYFNKPTENISVAYISQDSCLPEKVKTIELFKLYAKLYNTNDSEYNIIRIMTLLGLNKEKYKKRNLEFLSGGQKKRAHIGVELLRYPDLILIDEPDANLDKKNSKILMNYLASLSKLGITVVVTIHNRDFDDLFNQIIDFDE